MNLDRKSQPVVAMDILEAPASEPLRKRVKLSPETETVPSLPKNRLNPQIMKDPSVAHCAESSFNSTSTLRQNYEFQNRTVLDISNYIPAGSLRIRKSDCAISQETWSLCDTWAAFAHPRDAYSSGGTLLDNKVQENLFASRVLRTYLGLFHAEWIRMEFKVEDRHFGQVRIYILPDDVARGSIRRQNSALRKALQLLISQIDISKATWNGHWSEDTDVAHIDLTLDRQENQISLFNLFNSLPSPKPDPELVVDEHAREAMYRLLESNVEGLTTKMHHYQRRSAALMLQRETQPSQIIDPRLRPIVDQKGVAWYCDLDSSTCLKEPRTYESAKGGICAETMGLGKTLICLALILASKEMSSQIPVEYSIGTIPTGHNRSLKDMAAATIGRTGTPWKSYFAAMMSNGYEYTECLRAIKANAGFYHLPSPAPRRESRNPVIVPSRKIWLTTATIVVVPPNLVQQWRHEIKKHTDGLKVLVMNSNKAVLPRAQELMEYDLLLFSKQRFEKESQDGSDSQGRRRTTNASVCRCPYIGSTRVRDCTCFTEEAAYRSPLKDLHFKRLITDEGHTFGNSKGKTEANLVCDFLQISSRWIVSGTPTQGLYGAEVGLTHVSDLDELSSDGSSSKLLELPEPSDVSSEASSGEQEKAFHKQERKDLEKLGTIAERYLKARPWANSDPDDSASWSHHVMQPRHGSKSHGNMDCLRQTLESMIIRHRPEDVSQDIILPHLDQKVVYLNGSMQDRLSLNMFAMMIVTNAVTSERKDNDYFFHSRQRKNLQTLVSNMRQASFFWSNFEMHHVKSTIDVGTNFLEKREVPITDQDEALLREAIALGQQFLTNAISRAASKWHEMPVYINNECTEEVRAAWALDEDSRNPTLLGAGMVFTLQGAVQKQIWKEDPMEGLAEAGKKALRDAYSIQHPSPSSRAQTTPKDSKRKKTAEQLPLRLAGGVSTGEESSLKKRSRTSSVLDLTDEPVTPTSKPRKKLPRMPVPQGQPKSALKISMRDEIMGNLDPSSPLASASIISTASAKLSYLMDRLVAYHTTDKILVFYEADNTAWYIAQALECLHIKHLIYAKSLSTERRSKYVVTFNQSDDFRVLLMDVSQAAFGLDLSSASRVYFVNPVFSPQVEAQAVKRAHRIGQTKPVFVETLVLRGSMEEAIVERRRDMSAEEHNKCKSILDDQTMYDWIRNVSFLTLPGNDEVPGPEQMAKLMTPQLVFGRGGMRIGEHDPDAGLVTDGLSPISNKAKKPFFQSGPPVTMSSNAKGNQKAAFVVPESDGYISTDEEDEEDQNEQTSEELRLEAKERTITVLNNLHNRRLNAPSALAVSALAIASTRLHQFSLDDSLIGFIQQYQLTDERSGQVSDSSYLTAHRAWGLATSPRRPTAPASQLAAPRKSVSVTPQRRTIGPALGAPPSHSSSQYHDDGEIKFSTPKPKVYRPKTDILGMKLPNGKFKLPTRKYNSASSRAGIASSLTPSDTSTTDGGVAKKKELIVKLELGTATIEAKAIEVRSHDWRKEMYAAGAILGERGWQRTPGPSREPLPTPKNTDMRKSPNSSNGGDEEDESEPMTCSAPTSTPETRETRKRVSFAGDGDEEDDDVPKPSLSRRRARKKRVVFADEDEEDDEPKSSLASSSTA